MSSSYKWSIALGLCVAVPSTAFAADTTSLAARLHNAAESSSIDDPALKPWHLKLTFQLFDSNGKPTDEGSIEEWWSAGNDKRVYTSSSYNATEIWRDKGLYRTAGQGSAPYLLELLRDEVVHPLANDTEVNGSTPDLRVESFGQVKLDCIMLDHQMKNIAHPPLGLFPTYCLDQDKDRLRVSFRYGSEDVTRNSIGTFQGRGVPVDTAVTLNGGTAAKAHIATLEATTPTDQLFDPDSTVAPQNVGAVQVEAVVIAGSKIGGAVPVFPAEDKQSHTSGAVHMRALIGADGRIHRLTLIDTPSPTLAISALAAVRTWVYKPYLLNGLPCLIETTITVNYAFGN